MLFSIHPTLWKKFIAREASRSFKVPTSMYSAPMVVRSLSVLHILCTSKYIRNVGQARQVGLDKRVFCMVTDQLAAVRLPPVLPIASSDPPS